MSACQNFTVIKMDSITNAIYFTYSLQPWTNSVMRWANSLNVPVKTKRSVRAPGCKCSSGARWGRKSSPLGRCCRSLVARPSAAPAREPEPRRRNRTTGRKRTKMTRIGGWKTYCCFCTHETKKRAIQIFNVHARSVSDRIVHDTPQNYDTKFSRDVTFL